MRPSIARTTASIGVIGVAAALASPANAADPPAGQLPEDRMQQMQREIDELNERLSSLAGLEQLTRTQGDRIRELEAETGERWLTEQRVQQIRGMVTDVLKDSATRQALNPSGAYVGHDRNFFVATPDGSFRLNFEGQIQARFAWNHLPSGAVADSPGAASSANEYGFEEQSVRFNVFGNVFDPTWTYRMQFAYERDGAFSGNPLRFEDVFVQKSLGGGFYVRMGQWMNFLNYEQSVSYRTLEFADRSLVNQYFSTLFVQGILLGWESEQVRLYGSYNDGGNNRDIGVIQPSGNETNWAFTGRAEWKPFGAWGQLADMQGWRGSPFALMVGAGINWQRAAGSAKNRNAIGNGQLTPSILSPATLLTWAADASLRGDGWSVMAAFQGNLLYDTDDAAVAAGLDDVLSLGVVVQGGVFVTDSVELIAKYEGLWVDSGLSPATGPGYAASALNSQTMGIVSVGVNQYFQKNAIKITVDAGWALTPVRFNAGLFGQAVAAGDWRASETGDGAGEFVIRAQTQILF